MNSSKSAWPFQLFFANIKKRIENFFKSCFSKETSTQTADRCLLEQQSSDCLEIQMPEDTIEEESKANPPKSKFTEDSRLNRILKFYPRLNFPISYSSNLNKGLSFEPIYAEGESPDDLNLNKGLSFEPIYAEGQSPAEIKLKSFNAILETYKNISPTSIPHPIYQGLQWSLKVDSYPSHPIYQGLRWSSKVDSYPSSNSESLFLPIESEVKLKPEVKFLTTIDRASTSIEKPVLLISSTKVVTRTLSL